MKKVLIVFGALNALILIALAGMVLLSELYPLRPGGPFYALQDTAEQWRLRLSSSETRRAEVALDLAARRLADLAHADRPERIQEAALALNSAVDEAVRRIGAAPEAAQAALYQRLKAFLGQGEVVVTAIDGAGDDDILVALTQKVLALKKATTPEEMATIVPPKNTLLQTEPIPFLDSAVDHDSYPLLGGHGNVECEACHQEGQYVDTARDCASCHDVPTDMPYPKHFQGPCEDCHVVDDWAPSQFGHAGVVECQSCHLDELPAEHYARSGNYWSFVAYTPGDFGPPLAAGYSQVDNCATCHPSTSDWQKVSFDHAGFGDCQACHEPEQSLYGHYAGQCSWCHTTANWDPLEYDHRDTQECDVCHAPDVPINHYVRQESSLWYALWLPEHLLQGKSRPFLVPPKPETCANCHDSTSDWQEVSFDHTGFGDCASCHLDDDLPVGHEPGGCGECHQVTGWGDLAFDHESTANCQECHVPEAGHYPGNCAHCHDTQNWQQVAVDHSGLEDCAACHAGDEPPDHYTGQCFQCHNTTDWLTVSLDHTGLDDCRACHSKADHYRGQCSNCHGTLDWGQVWFNHAGFRDCVECHAHDAPAQHYNGQCSKCHGTDEWGAANFDHSGQTSCETCHIAPAGHYAGECQRCHTTSKWRQLKVSHTGFTDCRSCHTASDHWPGQCSECHNTDSWEQTNVDHGSLVDCTVCHTPPPGHHSSPCTDCHDTTDWHQVDVNHNELVDCQSCHEAPAGHWPGQCSDCHCTCDWSNIEFVHSITDDCQSCHSADAPAGHWPGQCSNCHNVSNWWDYQMDHTGLDDCESCHEAPEGHWPGTCSNCHHNTEDWLDLDFDHTGYSNCNACHVTDRPVNHPRGQCSKCHTTDGWVTPTPTIPPARMRSASPTPGAPEPSSTPWAMPTPRPPDSEGTPMPSLPVKPAVPPSVKPGPIPLHPGH